MDKSDLSAESHPRLACMMLIDTSLFMAGERIRKLNVYLRTFREQVLRDEFARERIELSIITFDRKVKVWSDFDSLKNLQLRLLATKYDRRFLGAAVCQALDHIEVQKSKYKNNGIHYYRPWLLIFTSGQSIGEPTVVVQQARDRLRSVQNGKHVRVSPIAIDEGVNPAELSDFAGTNVLPLKLVDLKKEYWLSSSQVVSPRLEDLDKDLAPPSWQVLAVETHTPGPGSIEVQQTVERVKRGEVVGPKIDEIGKDLVFGDTKESTVQQVQFTSYFPTEIKPNVWYTLLAYLHVKSAQAAVHEDSLIRLPERPTDYRQGYGNAIQTIARGTEIVVVPQLPGCRFNPPQATVLWLEDWHRIEFRMQASEEVAGFALNSAVNGSFSFYVGPILVGEIKVWAHVSDQVDSLDVERPATVQTSDAYQAVFVSYSHTDKQIVRELEKAYTALGIKYLRDVSLLRSGEEWNSALLKKIVEADIFQLCWSTTAKASDYVEREWRHALSLNRRSFIRPVYWETPMPEPPGELANIHFSFLSALTNDENDDHLQQYR